MQINNQYYPNKKDNFDKILWEIYPLSLVFSDFKFIIISFSKKFAVYVKVISWKYQIFVLNIAYLIKKNRIQLFLTHFAKNRQQKEIYLTFLNLSSSVEDYLREKILFMFFDSEQKTN